MRFQPFGDALYTKLTPIVQNVEMSLPGEDKSDTPHIALPQRITITRKPPPQPKKYIPPSQREKDSIRWQESTNNLRITNLPEYVSETELMELIRSYGCSVKRVKILRGGTSYVTMTTHRQAVDLVFKMDKTRVDSMILDVELVEPYNKKR
jgi:hypothetical protein